MVLKTYYVTIKLFASYFSAIVQFIFALFFKTKNFFIINLWHVGNDIANKVNITKQ